MSRLVRSWGLLALWMLQEKRPSSRYCLQSESDSNDESVTETDAIAAAPTRAWYSENIGYLAVVKVRQENDVLHSILVACGGREYKLNLGRSVWKLTSNSSASIQK